MFKKAAAIIILFSISFCAAGETTSDFRKVAGSSCLDLSFNKNNNQIIVHDKDYGIKWRSNPSFSTADWKLSDTVKAELQTPFSLFFTDCERTKIYYLDTSREKVAAKYEEIESGIRVTYTIEKQLEFYSGKICWSMEYRIKDDYLEVTIPEERIIEEGDFKITAMRVLPFFSADKAQKNGYLILPDGSGALVRFREKSPNISTLISLPLFGKGEFRFSPKRKIAGELMPRDIGKLLSQYDPVPKTAGIPMFGMISRGRGFAAIISSGEYNARIVGALSGIITDYNRIGVEFSYRKLYYEFLSRTKAIQKYEKTRIKGDRQIRYYLLPGPDAGYVDAAVKYRTYLIEEKGVKRKETGSLMDVRFFCGLNKTGLLAKEFVKTTSFSEAGNMLDALTKNGVQDISVTLVGWNKGGYEGNLPKKFPPEKKLGGEEGLKKFIDYAHSLNIPVFLEADYLTCFRGVWGFSVKKDTIKDANGISITDSEGTYLLSPRSAFNKFARQEIPMYKNLGTDGLALKYLGKIILPDYNERYPLQIADSAKCWSELMTAARKQGLKVRVQGANSYTYSYADELYAVDTSSSRFFYESEEIPLLQIVLHGLTPYYVNPLNLSYDTQRDILRMVEYGALPQFELTYSSPILLKDTEYNSLYSSYYRDWLDTVSKTYGIFYNDLRSISDKFIVGHRKLAAGVYKTEYENGTAVIVNYNGEDYKTEDINVKGMDYLLVEEN
jgi:hypothetical protein